jgi:hypothetical protein
MPTPTSGIGDCGESLAGPSAVLIDLIPVSERVVCHQDGLVAVLLNDPQYRRLPLCVVTRDADLSWSMSFCRLRARPSVTSSEIVKLHGIDHVHLQRPQAGLHDRIIPLP